MADQLLPLPNVLQDEVLLSLIEILPFLFEGPLHQNEYKDNHNKSADTAVQKVPLTY